ncbi:MAG: cytidylate kinase-like family protein [Bacteroidales bacterium]|jgi:cytidylate kinase|nr:cytidylate kinase-like family protein [Bacteroidales bacterium]
MDTQQKFVITINRQFGTNGRQIANQIAQELGVKLVDRQILSSLAENLNMPEDKLQQMERKKPTFWERVSYFYRNSPAMVSTPSVDLMGLTSSQIYKEQVDIMRSIAEEESCVVVGRLGFEVFKDHPNHMSIFMFSNLEDRVLKVMEMYGGSKAEALKQIKQVDDAREEFTREFTGKERNDATNYDLAVNVSTWGEKGTYDLLMSLIKG